MFEQLSSLPTVVSVIFRSIFGDVTSSRWFESWGGSKVAQTISSLVDLCIAFSRRWYAHTLLLLKQFVEAKPILREFSLIMVQLQATIQNGMNRTLSQFAKEENGSIFVLLRGYMISIISESNSQRKLLMCMIVLVAVIFIAYMFHFIISRNSNVLDPDLKIDDSLKSMDAKAKPSSLTSHLRLGNPGRGKASLSKPISPTVVPLTSVTLSKLATANPPSSSHQSVDSHLSTPPRDRGPHMTSEPGDERENDMARFTNLTGVSTLTPDSGFREIAWRMELNDEDQSGSEQHGSSSSSSYDSVNRGSDGRLNPSSVLQRSIKDPSALISWRIYVDKFGLGTIVGIRRKKFATTKFEVQFDNGQLHKLALKRSNNKGKVPFTLIKKIG